MNGGEGWGSELVGLVELKCCSRKRDSVRDLGIAWISF